MAHPFLLAPVLTDTHHLVASLAPNSGLLGQDDKEAALIRQWVHFAESEVLSRHALISGFLRGYISPYSKPVSFHI
jgi:elongation factor 1-gamma